MVGQSSDAPGEMGPSSPKRHTGGASAPSRQRQDAKPGYRPRLPVTSHRRCRSRLRVRTLTADRFAPARWHLRVCGHWRWMARVQVGRRVRTANPANLVFRSDGGEMLRSRPPYRGMAGKDPFRLWPSRAPAKRVIDASVTRTRACGRFDAGSRSIGERGAVSGRNGRRGNSSARAGLRAICPTNP